MKGWKVRSWVCEGGGRLGTGSVKGWKVRSWVCEGGGRLGAGSVKGAEG